MTPLVDPRPGERGGARIAVTLALVVPLAVLAGEPGPAASSPERLAQAPSGGAPVMVFNREVAVLRAPFFGVSAADRARRTEDRLGEVLAQGGPGVVSVRREPQGNVVLVDGAVGIILVPDDVDPLAGESLEAVTSMAQQAVGRAIAETREARDRGRMLHAISLSGIATLGFLLGSAGVLRARRGLFASAAALLETRASRAGVAGDALVRAGWLRSLARGCVHGLTLLVLGVLSYEWLAYVLRQFPYTRPWGETLGNFLLDVVHEIVGGVLHALPNLFIALVIFLLAKAATSLLGPVFAHIEQGGGEAGWLNRDSAAPTRKLVNVGIWLFALVMAYPYLPGAGSDAFKGMSVLIGLMVTWGGSNLVGQWASGMILMYSRTLRVGEYVRIAEQEGTVTDVKTFITRIRTGMGEEITLPNSIVLATTTKNYSRAVKGRGYVVDTVATIGYDTPWRQVASMLIEAARRTPGVLADPAPRVFQTALSDFYIEYRLVCQAIPEQPRPRAEVLDALHANIVDVFNEQGVQIMSPHYLNDPAAAKVVAADDPFAASAHKSRA
jgi:small-conductance mechanosensitive channel